jgi:DNA-binding response OmpR family regulator
MGEDKANNRLLIVEPEPRLLASLREHFMANGYRVEIALTGEDGLKLAGSARPHLILLSAQLNDMQGLDALRALRSKPRTGHIPVIVMAGSEEAMLQNKILEAGAYDVVEKPVDLDILGLRIRNTLRRAEREGLTEPRTGLPTGRLIDERVKALDGETGWRKIELTVEHFGVFRDRYGFVTANEALRHAGNLIAQLVNDHGTPHDFVGHVANSETFVIVTTQTRSSELIDTLRVRLTQELHSFYNFVEREQGYVVIEDGAGGQAQKPLMTAQIVTAQAESDSQAPSAPDDDPWVDAVDDDSPASGSAFEW